MASYTKERNAMELSFSKPGRKESSAFTSPKLASTFKSAPGDDHQHIGHFDWESRGARAAYRELSKRSPHEVKNWQNALKNLGKTYAKSKQQDRPGSAPSSSSSSSSSSSGAAAPSSATAAASPSVDPARLLKRRQIDRTRRGTIVRRMKQDQHPLWFEANHARWNVSGARDLLHMSSTLRRARGRGGTPTVGQRIAGEHAEVHQPLPIEVGSGVAPAEMSLQATVLRGDELPRPDKGPVLDMARVRELADLLRLGIPLPRSRRPLPPREEKLHQQSLAAVDASLVHTRQRLNHLDDVIARLQAEKDDLAEHGEEKDPLGVERLRLRQRLERKYDQRERRVALLAGLGVKYERQRTEARRRRQVADEFHAATLFAGAEQVMDNGDRYYGDFDHLNFKKEGRGTMFYFSGARYEGDWVDDLHDGRGTFTYRNGDVYTGSWRKGMKHGLGRITYSSVRCQYDGAWVDGRREGYGEWRDLRTGEHYQGMWQGGEREGRGVLRLSTGDYYAGSFALGHMEGYGEWRSSRTGMTIYGLWRESMFQEELFMQGSAQEKLERAGGPESLLEAVEREAREAKEAKQAAIVKSRETLREPTPPQQQQVQKVSSQAPPPNDSSAHNLRGKELQDLAAGKQTKLLGTSSSGTRGIQCPRCLAAMGKKVITIKSVLPKHKRGKLVDADQPYSGEDPRLCPLHRRQRRGAIRGGMIFDAVDHARPEKYDYAF
eukprot:g5081.t1